MITQIDWGLGFALYTIKFDNDIPFSHRRATEAQIEGEPPPEAEAKATALRSKGDRVKAKCPGWSKYYDGEITRANADGTYDIKFDDGERKPAVTEDMIEGKPAGEPTEADAKHGNATARWRRSGTRRLRPGVGASTSARLREPRGGATRDRRRRGARGARQG